MTTEDESKKRQRSYVMSRIRSKDTTPELTVRHWLFMHGYRYRKNVRKLPGTPDVVMRKYSVCIFVHGCFWHGHEHISMPKTNSDFWSKKITRNRERDEQNKKQLMQMGWNVITVWECQLTKVRLEQTMSEVEHWINRSLLIKAGMKFNKHIGESHAYTLEEDEMETAAESNLIETQSQFISDQE